MGLIKNLFKKTKKTCGNCHWYVAGNCNRYPPTVGVYPDNYDQIPYPHFDQPIVYEKSSACGEWRKK